MTDTPRPPLLHARRRAIEPEGDVTDDRLRLIFTCCHPALAPSAQIALTLRLLGGLETPYIARAFLVPEQRWPSASCARSRRSVTHEIPLPRTERGRAAEPAPPGADRDLSRVQRGLHRDRGRRVDPRRPVCRGDPARAAAGRAHARRARGARPARFAAAHRIAARGAHCRDGSFVLLPEQDRSLWDRALIDRGSGDRAALPAPQHARAVPDPSRHQRGAQRRRHRGRHRLGPDTRAVRPVGRARAEPDRRTEPRGRGRRGRRAGGRARGRSTRSTSTVTTCSTSRGPSSWCGSTATQEARAAFDRALALAANSAERAHLEQRIRDLDRELRA